MMTPEGFNTGNTKTEKILEKTPPLTFESFCTWQPEICNGKQIGLYPAYNNFFLRFVPWPKKNHPAVKGMQKEIPGLFRGISQRVCETMLRLDMYSKASEQEREQSKMEKPDLYSFLKAIEGELYQAYLVARNYVETDQELFR
ncbi:hypothetical protein JW911_01765 [Candidatus Peregrinibacteria bacterium]|nr:hypothetical protein [Candidatus Peregrinibacteria bacterium]